MKELFLNASLDSSKVFTNTYSTSFSLGIRMLHKDLHEAIYGIYGFVRVADEIVDTFHDQNKDKLINEFKSDTFSAIEKRFSTNPILHSFQWAVNEYGIESAHVEAFFDSMIMDLSKTKYNREEYEKYIYGSAEVVGLMCLRVFCQKDNLLYENLVEPARKLGSAFQKINFLRDLKADYFENGRMYFPDLDIETFGEVEKQKIEEELETEFNAAYEGIKRLPDNCRFGVYTAYIYYLQLFKKIKHTEAAVVKKKRIRVSNFKKYLLLIRSFLRHRLLAG